MAILGLPVPDGDCCWNEKTTKICSYFNAEGGGGRCDIFHMDIEGGYSEEEGYIKYKRPKFCEKRLRSR